MRETTSSNAVTVGTTGRAFRRPVDPEWGPGRPRDLARVVLITAWPLRLHDRHPSRPPALYSKLSAPRCLTPVGTEGGRGSSRMIWPGHMRVRSRSFVAARQRRFRASHRVATSPRGLLRTLWLLVVVVLLVAACGDRRGGIPALTWYINPDNGGQGRLAASCTKEANGAYRIDLQMLPSTADAQREQLVRRLAGRDSSIDLMSLDPPFVAEFANAGFLHEITRDDDVASLTDGMLEAPLRAAYWNGTLVAVPLWANTQLLWFRKSVAAAAGVDPTGADFTWQDAIAAAERQKKIVAVQ